MGILDSIAARYTTTEAEPEPELTEPSGLELFECYTTRITEEKGKHCSFEFSDAPCKEDGRFASKKECQDVLREEELKNLAD